MNNQTLTHDAAMKEIAAKRLKIEKCDELIKSKINEKEKLAAEIADLNRQYNASAISSLGDTITAVADLVTPEMDKAIAEFILTLSMKNRDASVPLKKIVKKPKAKKEVASATPSTDAKKDASNSAPQSNVSEFKSAAAHAMPTNDLETVQPWN